MTDVVVPGPPVVEVPDGQPSTKRLALYGTGWAVAGFGVAQVLRLASNLILTRLLAPSVFGAMALVQITLQGLTMFSDIGVGPAVIRAKDSDGTFLDTAWTLQFVRGWILWVACIALAEPMARFYHLPELRYLIMVSGAQVAISSCQSMSMFTENKKLALKKLVLLALVSQAIGLAVMIFCAITMRNIWALVIGALAGVTATTAGSFIFLPGPWPHFCWNKPAVLELFHFGKWIFVSTIMTFFAGQLDRIMLGKLVPLAVLGVYSVAMTLATLPNNVISHLASMILYPIFAKHADDDRQYYVKKVLKARLLMLPIGAVIVAGLATIAPPFFHYLYDSRYAAAGWMAQLLALYIWFWMLQVSADRALIALGDTRSVSISNFVNLVMTVVGCLTGYHFAGLAGFILGLAFSSAAGHLIIEIALYRHGINIFLQDIVVTLLAGALLAAALLMGHGAGAVVAGHLRQPMNWVTSNLIIFAVAVAVATNAYRVLRRPQ